MFSTNLSRFRWQTLQIAAVFVFTALFSAPAMAAQNMEWQRYRDSVYGITVRYPANWGFDTRPRENEETHRTTFIAPRFATDTAYRAWVEFHVANLNGRKLDITTYTKDPAAYYQSRPDVYRFLKQRVYRLPDGNTAVEFTYNIQGEDAAAQVTEVWQILGNTAVSLRLGTTARMGNREGFYHSILDDMLASLTRQGPSLTEPQTDLDVFRTPPQYAVIPDRTNFSDHRTQAAFTTSSNLQLALPATWQVREKQNHAIAEVLSIGPSESVGTPLLFTSIDLYQAFIASTKEFSNRDERQKWTEREWMQTVYQALKKKYRTPQFNNVDAEGLTISGKSAIMILYEQAGTRYREVFFVHGRRLYSFKYKLSGTDRYLIEQIVESARLL